MRVNNILLNKAKRSGFLTKVEVISHQAATQEDYQVQVEDIISRKGDGEDIQFFQKNKVLDYWKESYASWKLDAWTKLSKLPVAKSQILNILSGNPITENPDSVFDFFDDFEEDTTLNYKIFATNGAYAADEGPVANYNLVTPSSIYNSTQNKTYIVYNSDDYKPKILYYDHSTDTFSDVQDIGGSVGTTHGPPCIAIDSSGYIYVFYHHYPLYFKKSTNPFNITAWGSETTVAANGAYPNIYFYNGTLYLLFRNKYTAGADYQLAFKTSTDGGVNWSALTKLTNFNPGAGDDTYGMYYINSSGTIHAAWGWYKTSTSKRHDVYYMKSEDGGSTWKKADGTTLTIPVTNATAEKVFNSGANFTNMASGCIKADSTGKPLLLFSSNQIYKLARWNGSSWGINDIVGVDNDFDAGALVLESDSEYRAYITIGTGRGGELKEYKSINSGVDWTYVKTISGGLVGSVQSTYNIPNDRKLEIIFCGGDGGNNAVCAWGKNCTYTSTIRRLNTDKWTFSKGNNIGGSQSVSGSKVTINSYGDDHNWASPYIAAVPRILHNHSDIDLAIRTKLDGFNPATNYQGGGIILRQDDDDAIWFDIVHNNDGIVEQSYTMDTGVRNNLSHTIVGTQTNHYLEITRLSNTFKTYYRSNSSAWAFKDTLTKTMTLVDLGLCGYDAGDPSFDWILVRKYASPEPLIIKRKISGKAGIIKSVCGGIAG